MVGVRGLQWGAADEVDKQTLFLCQCSLNFSQGKKHVQIPPSPFLKREAENLDFYVQPHDFLKAALNFYFESV